MMLPDARGEVSARVFATLLSPPGATDVGPAATAVEAALQDCADLLGDEDLQLTLLVLYELHYQGLQGVDDRWEWNPDLLRLRAQIEEAFEATLRSHVHVEGGVGPQADDVARALFAMAAADTGPGLSSYVAKRATDEQLH